MIPKDLLIYDRILLPTDGSDGTQIAVEQAVEHAKTYDAELHVLHVVDQSVVDLSATPAASGITADVLREQFDDEGQTLVEAVAAQATQAASQQPQRWSSMDTPTRRLRRMQQTMESI